MYIDPALLSPVSVLLGALVGGGASLLGTIYSQRSQDRVQRVASEIAKRESVYADFVMSASNLLLNAYTHDEIVLSGDVERMIGLINRSSLWQIYIRNKDGKDLPLASIAMPASSSGRRSRCWAPGCGFAP
jgi:hypothetical protein